MGWLRRHVLCTVIAGLFASLSLATLCPILFLHGHRSAHWEFNRVGDRNVVVALFYLNPYVKLEITYWVEPIRTGKSVHGTRYPDRFLITHDRPRPEKGKYFGTIEGAVSLWVPAIVFGLYPGIMLRRAIGEHRARARESRGYCRCGYDLRSLKDRPCPECGRPAPGNGGQAGGATLPHIAKKGPCDQGISDEYLEESLSEANRTHIADPVFGPITYELGGWTSRPDSPETGFMISIDAPESGPSTLQREFFDRIRNNLIVLERKAKDYLKLEAEPGLDIEALRIYSLVLGTNLEIQSDRFVIEFANSEEIVIHRVSFEAERPVAYSLDD